MLDIRDEAPVLQRDPLLDQGEGLSDRNPFATRYVRPGALEFLFPPAMTAQRLVDRLQRNGWMGQICGPHGSGKSTLLATLIPALQAASRTTHLVVLRNGQSRWPRETTSVDEWDHTLQVLVDGFEQLGWLTRRRLLRWCRKRNSGLLVTAHQPMGLPEVWSTETSLSLANELLERWLTDAERRRVPRQAVEMAFRDCGGNLRETWFRLYDVFQTAAATAGAT